MLKKTEHFRLDFLLKDAPHHYVTVCKISKREVDINPVSRLEPAGSVTIMSRFLCEPGPVVIRL